VPSRETVSLWVLATVPAALATVTRLPPAPHCTASRFTEGFAVASGRARAAWATGESAQSTRTSTTCCAPAGTRLSRAGAKSREASCGPRSGSSRLSALAVATVTATFGSSCSNSPTRATTPRASAPPEVRPLVSSWP